jgi:hypothetical protein
MLTHMVLHMQVKCSVCHEALKGPAQIRCNGSRICGKCVQDRLSDLPGISAVSSLLEDRENLVQLSQQLQEQLQLGRQSGQGPAPDTVLQLLQHQLPDEWHQRTSALQDVVRSNLPEEVRRRVLQKELAAGVDDAAAAVAADAAQAAAAGVAESLVVTFVAAATKTRSTLDSITSFAHAHDVLAAAGEGASPEDLLAKLDAHAAGTPVVQEEQTTTCLAYVKEDRDLLLTHALQLKTLRNQDGSCGWGAHSGEVAFYEASGEDPVDAAGVKHISIIRSAIGDLIICAWALTFGVVTLILTPAAPQVSTGPCAIWQTQQ